MQDFQNIDDFFEIDKLEVVELVLLEDTDSNSAMPFSRSENDLLVFIDEAILFFEGGKKSGNFSYLNLENIYEKKFNDKVTDVTVLPNNSLFTNSELLESLDELIKPENYRICFVKKSFGKQKADSDFEISFSKHVYFIDGSLEEAN